MQLIILEICVMSLLVLLWIGAIVYYGNRPYRTHLEMNEETELKKIDFNTFLWLWHRNKYDLEISAEHEFIKGIPSIFDIDKSLVYRRVHLHASIVCFNNNYYQLTRKAWNQVNKFFKEEKEQGFFESMPVRKH